MSRPLTGRQVAGIAVVCVLLLVLMVALGGCSSNPEPHYPSDNLTDVRTLHYVDPYGFDRTLTAGCFEGFRIILTDRADGGVGIAPDLSCPLYSRQS